MPEAWIYALFIMPAHTSICRRPTCVLSLPPISTSKSNSAERKECPPSQSGIRLQRISNDGWLSGAPTLEQPYSVSSVWPGWRGIQHSMQCSVQRPSAYFLARFADCQPLWHVPPDQALFTAARFRTVDQPQPSPVEDWPSADLQRELSTLFDAPSLQAALLWPSSWQVFNGLLARCARS